jgi:hypothetical protein
LNLVGDAFADQTRQQIGDWGDNTGQVWELQRGREPVLTVPKCLRTEDEVRAHSVRRSLESELHLHRLGPIVGELERVACLSEGQGRRDERLHIDHALVDIVDRDGEFLMKPK